MGLLVAQEEGNIEEEEKQSKRLVRAGKKENDDVKKLLDLMGVPVVNAPMEAEAQACALAVKGLVYAVGTEDMDALTFKAPVLLRKMTFANAKTDLQSLSYSKALEGLELTHDQFVDLCILLGCDYCDSIRGIGPKTALKLVKEHGCIENILKNIEGKKYGVPDDWIPNEIREKKKKEDQKKKEDDDYNTDDEKEEKDSPPAPDTEPQEEQLIPIYVQARKLFNDHEVDTDVELKWRPCKPDELKDFLVDKMGFNVDRVKSNIERLQKAYKSTEKPQTRMDSFFSIKKAPNADKLAAKRKADKAALKKQPKKGKKGSFGRKK